MTTTSLHTKQYELLKRGNSDEMTLFMNAHEHIEDQIPSQFQEIFKKLKNDFVQHTSTFAPTFTTDNTRAKRAWLFNTILFFSHLFDFVLLVEINEKISLNDSVYVCAGAKHIRVVETALQQEGYKRIARTRNPLKLPSIGLGSLQVMASYPESEIGTAIDLKKALENLDKGVSDHVLQPPINAASVA